MKRAGFSLTGIYGLFFGCIFDCFTGSGGRMVLSISVPDAVAGALSGFGAAAGGGFPVADPAYGGQYHRSD
jgi:hypothetical protein